MELEKKVHFCEGLCSKPQPDIGLILVTGATGYIGGHLVPELLERGYKVRMTVRKVFPDQNVGWPNVEVVEADALDYDSIVKALKGVRIAYYLIHSMSLGAGKFEKADIQAANNFQKAAEKNGVTRIIYLGGLGDEQSSLSSHLQSRLDTAKALKSGKVPITILRAAVIIGSGSASYEIIKHLVKNLPIFVFPAWAKTRCQPIALQDVIKYLIGVLEISETTDKTFDIGGNEVLSYRKMLKLLAEVLGKKRFYLFIPYTSIRLYADVVSLLTPIPAPIIHTLMRSLRNDVICENNDIKQYFQFDLLSYKLSMIRALSREEQDAIYPKWTESNPSAYELALKLHEVKSFHPYSNSFSLKTDKNRKQLFQSICNIGGKNGWFHRNWIWRLKGKIDRLFIKVKSSDIKPGSDLRINDVIEFWRVEDIVPEKKLILRAEMILAGIAWLEFSVGENENKNYISIKTYYYSANIIGKIYWFVCLPFHTFIFYTLIKSLEKRS